MQEIYFDDLRKRADHTAEILFVRAWMAAGDPKHTPGEPFKVIFNINGNDVDFAKFTEDFYRQYHDEVVEAAAELLKKKTNLCQVTDTIDAFTRTIEGKLKEMVSQLLDVPPEIAEKMISENRY